MHKRNILKKLILLGGDALLIAAAYYLSPAIRFGAVMDFFTVFQPYDVASILIYLMIFYISDIYNLDASFKRGIFIIRFGISLVIASIFIAAIFFLFRVPLYSTAIFLLNSGLIFVFCLGWRIVFERAALENDQPLRLAVLGTGKSGRTFYEMAKGRKDIEIVLFLDDDERKWGHAVGSVPIIGGSNLLHDLVRDRKIDHVILAFAQAIDPAVYKRLIAVKFSGVNVYELPTFWEITTGEIPVGHVNDVWFINSAVSGVRRTIYTRRAKRVIEIPISLLMLLIALPFMVLIGLAIRLDSPGPALFFQKRIGYRGRPFNLIKFRTMRSGREMERANAGRHDDPRITCIGKVLRLSRLDELPQLWNILKGEMSFIGPRALMEEEVREFEPQIPYFGLRHAIHPGITGWAQVNYPHGTTREDALKKLQYDLYYLKNMSFIMDLHILLRTVRVVLLGRGAR